MRQTTWLAAFAWALTGCESDGPALLAVAYPESVRPNTFDLVREVLDTAPGDIRVGLADWHLTGPGLSLQASQAEAFAANPDIVGVVGHAGSRDALLGAVVYNREGLPQVIPTGTSRELQRAGPWTFMMAPNDSVEGAFIADWALDSARAARIAVMYLGDEYGIGIREGVRAGLAARNVQTVDEVLIPAHNCTPAVPVYRDVMRLLAGAMVHRARPDAVILAAAEPNGWCLTGELHAIDDSLWVIGADGFNVRNALLSSRTPHNPARLRAVSFWAPGPDSLSRWFAERFTAITSREPDGGSAMLFDAFLVLQRAVHEVGPNRRAVRDWLASLGSTRAPFAGVTGPVYFNRPRAELLRMIAPPTADALVPRTAPE